MEFPIGKKLFHLVVNPGTWRCPTVDLELVETTRNVNLVPRALFPGFGGGKSALGTRLEKRKWNTTFRAEIQTGKTGPPF